MSKLIIYNHTSKDMEDVLSMAREVVGCGRISDGGYCYATTFHNGIVCNAVKKQSVGYTGILGGRAWIRSYN